MIIWDKKNGYIYEDESNGKRYSLYEAKCYEGEATSDIVIIWDEAKNNFANYVYGASDLFKHIEELDNTIKYYVGEYAKKEPKAKITYPLNNAGVSAWCGDVVDDILDRGVTGDYIISHCGRQIMLPDLAEIHESIEYLLSNALEVIDE